VTEEAVDPDNLTLTIGNLVTGAVTELVYGEDAELVRSGVGVYIIDYKCDEVGHFTGCFWCTGAIQDAKETSWVVEASLAREEA